MIIGHEETEALFDTIRDDLCEPTENLLAIVESFRPLDPSLMDWRFELMGFVRGLLIGGLISSKAVKETREVLFGPVKPNEQREGRDFHYSIDVHSRSVDGSERTIQFDVAAMNTMDAYVQLTKRLVYRTIPDVFKVDVFIDFLKNRTEIQNPARRFEKDELIFVVSR